MDNMRLRKGSVTAYKARSVHGYTTTGQGSYGCKCPDMRLDVADTHLKIHNYHIQNQPRAE